MFAVRHDSFTLSALTRQSKHKNLGAFRIAG